MPRPLMQLGVGDLEALFVKSKVDVKALKQLEHELQYRQVPRAVNLLAEVQAALATALPEAPAASPARPAAAPKQAGLWERISAPAPAPVAAPVAASRPALPSRVADVPAKKEPPSVAPSMPVDEACKLLKTTTGSTWESIEQTRRQLVQQSSPSRTSSMSPEGRTQILAEASRVNAAYAVLSKHRAGA
jgi:hypothetical protein